MLPTQPSLLEQQACRTHPLAAEEWLASRILESLADPRAVCQLALLNKNFFSASTSDLVWEKLLPPPACLDSILADIPEEDRLQLRPLSKRDLYFRLCQSITYGEGLKKFWLDPSTGGDCYMISARLLSIAWGDSPQHWEWKSCHGSCFHKVAHLNWVCWFDTPGTFQHFLRAGTYVVSFRILLDAATSWWDGPLKLHVQNVTYAHPLQETEVSFNHIHLFTYKSPTPLYIGGGHTDSSPSWLECDAGEFIVEQDDDDDDEAHLVEIKFTMQEVHRLLSKRGLVLDGVIIRPRYVVDSLARERPEAPPSAERQSQLNIWSQADNEISDDNCYNSEGESEQFDDEYDVSVEDNPED